MSEPKRLRRNPDIIAAEAMGEKVMLDLAAWEYLSFNPTATWLWERLDEPRTLAWLVAAAQDTFNGAAATMRSDLEDFLEFLLRKRLILAESD